MDGRAKPGHDGQVRFQSETLPAAPTERSVASHLTMPNHITIPNHNLSNADRWSRWFSADSRFWFLASVTLGTVSILKGIRLPSLWAATQMRNDYETGFVKRGLFGEILSKLGLYPESYLDAVLISGILFSAMICMLIWHVWRTGSFHFLGQGLAVGLFCASYALTYVAHTIGYLDICLILLTLGILSTSGQGAGGILLTGLAAVLGILIHELYLIVFFPLTILPFVLNAASHDTVLRRIAPVSILVLSVVGFTFVELSHAVMTDDEIRVLRSAMAAGADFGGVLISGTVS